MLNGHTHSITTSYDNGQYTIVETMGNGKTTFTFKGVGATKKEAAKQIDKQVEDALIKELNAALTKSVKEPAEKPAEKKPCVESNSTLNKLKLDYKNLKNKYAALLADYEKVCAELEELQEAVKTPEPKSNADAMLEEYIQQFIDAVLTPSNRTNPKE